MPHTIITIREYCRYHQPVEPQFLHALAESGLIRLAVASEPALEYDEIPAVERYSRMHYDLGINPEGLEAVAHLLQRLEDMHDRIRLLEQRLKAEGEGASADADFADY